MPARRTMVEIEGKTLSLSNLDKVLYPATGFTKLEVIDYYRQIAPVLLPHLRRRPITFVRAPEGVDGEHFYEKHRAGSAPDFIGAIEVPGRSRPVTFPAIDSLTGLVWAANLAAIELHVPQWQVGRDGKAMANDLLVFDLDPGEGADLSTCAEVALLVRDELLEDRLVPVVKLSGSKGIQLSARRPPARRRADPSEYAKALAIRLEQRRGDLIISRMAKRERTGKIFIDWSQNNPAKTTVAPYSLRARTEPRVAAPITWEEVETLRKGEDLEHRICGPSEVLARVAADGDLFAPLLDRAKR